MPGNDHENDWGEYQLLYICNLQCHYPTKVFSFFQIKGSQIAQRHVTDSNQINPGLRQTHRDKGQHLATWNLTLQTDFQQEETLLAHTRKNSSKVHRDKTN